MHKSTLKDSGKECEVYDNYEEVEEIAFQPPKYCEKDAAELRYYSFFDSLNRFTLYVVCPVCGSKRAISVRKEKYETRMLDHWADMVKDRAGNKCEMADGNCSGELHAHHIIPKHLDPNKKYSVENGICLCAAHHKMIHHYM